MALSNPPGVDFIAGANTATRVYGPATWAPGARIFIPHFQRASANNTTPGKGSISDTLGWSWIEVADAVVAGATGIPGHRITLWSAIAPSGAANTITLTRGSNSGFHGAYSTSFLGASNDLSNVATDSDTGGILSATLPAAPAATSTNIAFYTDHLGTATTPPAGYSELRDDLLTGTLGAIQYCYDNGAPPQITSWSETGRAAAIVLEVREPAAHVFAIAAGVFSLTGQGMSLTRRAGLGISPGSYVRTGTAIGLKAGLSIDLTPGSHALTGTSISFGRGTRCLISGGVYSLAGQALGLAAHFGLETEAGTLAISGISIGLSYGRSMSVDGGVYVLDEGMVGFTRVRGQQVTPRIRIMFARDEGRRVAAPHQMRRVRPLLASRTVHISPSP